MTGGDAAAGVESPTQTFGFPWPDLNDGLSYHDLVSPSHHESTLIQFYSSKYKNSAPSTGWLQRIQNGQITIDGQVVTDPNFVVRAGSKLIYHRLPWREPDAPHTLEILYEDEDVVALNKPSGLQVLPGGLFQQRTVLTQLHWRTTRKISQNGCEDTHPAPVHRLGRGTSGILLCAKTKLAKTRLASHFADKTSLVGRNRNSDVKHNKKMADISKIYRALVSGILNEDEVVIDQPIGLVRYTGVANGLYVASISGKPALSKVNVLQRDGQNNCTLVQVEIQSGRPHQIRIHLSFIGHPLLGDPLYIIGGQPKCFHSEQEDEKVAQDGGYRRPTKPVPGDCGYHLHAYQLNFPHPATEKVIKVAAPLPSLLQIVDSRD